MAAQNPREGTSPASTSLGNVIGTFKSITTHEIIMAVRRGEVQLFAGKIWQRNYYEHILRNEEELISSCQYILDNASNWSQDVENSDSERPTVASP